MPPAHPSRSTKLLICSASLFVACGQALPEAGEQTQALSAWQPQTELGYDSALDTWFGSAVQSDGQLLVVSGSRLYAFEHSADGWAKLEAPPQLLTNLAVSGSTLFGTVGASGLVFRRSGSGFMLEAELLPNLLAHESIGTAAMAADTVMLAAYGAGEVDVFERGSSGFSQTQTLPIRADFIALSTDTAVIVAGYDTVVYAKDHGTWTLQQTIPERIGAWSFARVSGNFLLLVSPFGEAQILSRAAAGEPWGSPETLTSAFDLSRPSVIGVPYIWDLSGRFVIAGSPYADSERGAAYVFEYLGDHWSSAQPLPAARARFGSAVALWPGGAAVTAMRKDIEPNHGAYGRGSVFVYDLTDEPERCDSNDQCASTHCVDNVCCDSACDGAGQSCLASRKGFGLDGFCGAPLGVQVDPNPQQPTLPEPQGVGGAPDTTAEGGASGAGAEVAPDAASCAATLGAAEGGAASSSLDPAQAGGEPGPRGEPVETSSPTTGPTAVAHPLSKGERLSRSSCQIERGAPPTSDGFALLVALFGLHWRRRLRRLGVVDG